MELLGLLGVASGSVWLLKPKCPHLLPLPLEQVEEEDGGPDLNLLPQESHTLSSQLPRPPLLLCLLPLRTSNTTYLSQ